jgi:hypothetical protein
MKKIVFASILMSCLAGIAQADLSECVCYTNHVSVNECLLVYLLHPEDSACWLHSNPYPGDYEEALEDDLICKVTLTVNACDIEPCDDKVGVKLEDKDGHWRELGYLNNGDTVFCLDPEWLDTVKVKATLYYTGSICDWWDDAKIICSDLTVCAVPVPGAVLLGMLGLSAAGLKLRKWV